MFRSPFAFLFGPLSFNAVAVVAFFACSADCPFDVAVAVGFVDSSEHLCHYDSPS